MKSIKATPKHKLGNMIAGVCSIIEGICLILSLGNYHPALTFKWAMFRLKTGVLHDRYIKRY